MRAEGKEGIGKRKVFKTLGLGREGRTKGAEETGGGAVTATGEGNGGHWGAGKGRCRGNGAKS